jgi:hypothetical protein
MTTVPWQDALHVLNRLRFCVSRSPGSSTKVQGILTPNILAYMRQLARYLQNKQKHRRYLGRRAGLLLKPRDDGIGGTASVVLHVFTIPKKTN